MNEGEISSAASKKEDGGSAVRQILRIVLSLTVICICVALAVSASYSLTRDRIEEQRLNTERAAIGAVFNTESISYKPLENAPGDVSAVFEVSASDGAVCGWAVSVSPSGFGGNIDMIVGIAPDGTLVGVNITALSETPGLGSRVNDEGYLSQYAGLSGGKLSLGTDVVAISGATISSRSVLAGVNRALGAVESMGLTAPGAGE